MTREKYDWHSDHKRSLTRGERAADVLRNAMGSWRFVAAFLLVMLGWTAANVWGNRPWDPYPFILLNLFLSMLAGLQGAILLIAAKRQDAVSAAMARHDFETDTAAKEEIELLLAINREQLEIIRQLRDNRP